jgi:hypothetical protein
LAPPPPSHPVNRRKKRTISSGIMIDMCRLSILNNSY